MVMDLRQRISLQDVNDDEKEEDRRVASDIRKQEGHDIHPVDFASDHQQLNGSGPTENVKPDDDHHSDCDDDEEEDDDSSSSSSSSDDDSVLSGPKWREYWPNQQQQQNQEGATRQRATRKNALIKLRSRLRHYQRLFVKREQLLQRISSGKGKAFIQQLREREVLVQHQTFQTLLHEADTLVAHGTSNRSSTKDATAYKELRQALEASKCELELLRPTTANQSSWLASRLRQWQDFVVFERHALVPAVVALLVHTIALNSIYEGLNMCAEVIKQHIVAVSGQWIDLEWIHLFFMVGTLTLGVGLLRCTGDLYWWLSDPDFDLVKFDFHNRRWLRFWDARVLAHVRVARPTARAVLFVVGYHFCYTSMSEFLFWMERFIVDQGRDIVAKLPSTLHDAAHGTCVWTERDMEESMCTRSCHDEMVRQEQEFLSLKQLDMDYTSSILSSGSNDYFWFQWTQNDGLLPIGMDVFAIPLYKKYHHCAYILSFTLMAILILAAYGFKFWGKY